MRTRLPGTGVAVAIALTLALILGVTAKDKPATVAVQGRVFLIDQSTSALMVDTKTQGRRLVLYSVNTKFEYGRSGKARESSVDQIKETDYISCTGTLDDRERLIATHCLHRESK